jgi:DNA-binding NtrC family response regulator
MADTFAHIVILDDKNRGRGSLICETLEELGYCVSVVQSDYDACRAMHDGGVDLLIAGISAINSTTHDVVNYASSMGIPCVLLSKSQSVRERLLQPASVFIDNPFTLDELANQVDLSLRANPGPPN